MHVAVVMMKRFHLLLTALCLCLTLSAAYGQFAFFKPKTQVGLLLDATAVRPGETVMAGVRLEMPDKWHTYWRAPGEVGKATEISWKLPPGITAGEIRWPLPKRMVAWDLISFEYAHEVVLLVPLTVGQEVKGPQRITAQVSWLECETDGSCVPGKGEASAGFAVGAERKASPQAEEIRKWAAKLPRPAPAMLHAAARWEGPAKDNKRHVLIEWETKDAKGATGDFWSYHAGNDWQMHPKLEPVEAGADRRVIRKRIDLLEGSWPQELRGMIVDETAGKTGLEITLPIAAAKFAAKPAAQPATAVPTAVPALPSLGLPNPFGDLAGPQTKVDLVFEAAQAGRGTEFWAALKFDVEAPWHIYWRNPGSPYGLPIKLEWELPAGITVAATRWPVPERKEYDDPATDGTYLSYELNGENVLLARIRVAPSVKGEQELRAKVSWAECQKGDCVPRDRTLSARVVIGDEFQAGPAADRFPAWLAKADKPQPQDFSATARWETEPVDGKRNLLIALADGATNVDFYPDLGAGWSIAARSEVTPTDGGGVVVRKVVTSAADEWPQEFAGILVNDPDAPGRSAHEVRIAIGDGATAATAGGVGAAAATGSPVPAGTERSLIVWLLFAFVGGLILNIMPCVLPVISLKILGFVNQANEEPATVRRLGFVYTLGVLVSFLALAGLVIAVQKAGDTAVWGMQFGNPVFVVCLTTIVTLVALNLFGVFEITLSSGTMTAANSLASKHGPAGAFFNGILTTVLATPCTAPFLIGALGFAFTQPAAIIVLVFLTVGLGLASPYLFLSCNPKWLKHLPKPGNWMVRFKEAMGFPMLATAFWLLSIAARRFGVDGVLWLGFFLVMVSLAAWIWGSFVQRGGRRRGLSMLLALGCVAAGYVVALENNLRWRDPAPVATATAGAAGSASLLVNPKQKGPDGIKWYPWSHAAIAEAQSQGHPVLVDFTAKWCVTCIANKASSIEIESTRAKLKELNFISLIGDATEAPPDIREELVRFRRPGVPLVLVYPADPAREPVVLPTVLTPGIVHEALERAAKSGS